MLTASLVRLEFRTQLRSLLPLVVALTATLIYIVPAALNPDLSWLELGVEVASWSSVLLSLAYFHTLAQSLGKDSGGLREMIWARPISSIRYVCTRLAASIGMLVSLWFLSTLLALAVRGFTLGPPTSWELSRYLLYNATIAIPNLVFIASGLLFISAITDQLMAVYGTGLLIWLAGVVLPRNDKLEYFYPFYLPPAFLSQTAGYGGFWQVLFQNRAYALLIAALLIFTSGYALSLRRRTPERRVLITAYTELPLLAGSIFLLSLAPSPTTWLERNQSVWMERALAAAQGNKSYVWQRHQWNGFEGMTLPGGAMLEIVVPVIKQVQAEPELVESLDIDAVIQVPFLRETQLRDHVLLIPETYAERTPEALTRRIISDLAKLKWRLSDTMRFISERHALTYVHEWYLTKQIAGQEVLDKEINLWRSVIGASTSEDIEVQRSRTQALNELARLGAVGGPVNFAALEEALVLWDGPVQREGARAVLLRKSP